MLSESPADKAGFFYFYTMQSENYFKIQEKSRHDLHRNGLVSKW